MKQITEDYVSYETAVLLKEKWFDEPCVAYWDEDNNILRITYPIHPFQNTTNPCFFGQAAPTLQMTLKWLREVHKIHIAVNVGCDVDNKNYVFYTPTIVKLSNKSVEYIEPFSEDDNEFDSNEEAVEAAILYVLKNLI